MIDELVIGGRQVKIIWVKGVTSDALEEKKLSVHHIINNTVTFLSDCTPEVQLIELTYYGLYLYLDDMQSDIDADSVRRVASGLIWVASQHPLLLDDEALPLKELYVGSVRYTVKYNEGDRLTGSNIGEHSYYLGRITIHIDLEPNRKLMVLWHEITHAVDRLMSCDMTEQQVGMVSHSWFALLHQNPKLVEMIKSTYHHAAAVAAEEHINAET